MCVQSYPLCCFAIIMRCLHTEIFKDPGRIDHYSAPCSLQTKCNSVCVCVVFKYIFSSQWMTCVCLGSCCDLQQPAGQHISNCALLRYLLHTDDSILTDSSLSLLCRHNTATGQLALSTNIHTHWLTFKFGHPQSSVMRVKVNSALLTFPNLNVTSALCRSFQNTSSDDAFQFWKDLLHTNNSLIFYMSC